LNDFCRLLNNLTAKEGLGLTKVRLGLELVVVRAAQVKVVHLVHNIRAALLSGWHYRVVDPPLRTERCEPMENKVVTTGSSSSQPHNRPSLSRCC
jgi:hypothetical protein